MVRNNFLGDVQPQAGPFAKRLGGKERLGHHRQLMRGNPHPSIMKDEVHRRQTVDDHALGGDLEAFVGMSSGILLVQGVPRIIDDVDNALLDLLKVHLNRRQVVGQVDGEGDALLADLRLGENDGFRHNGRDDARVFSLFADRSGRRKAGW